MKTNTPFCITREKHLDHMTKVVPFIVFCYAVQSYVVYSISPTEFSQISLCILGCVLACMVSCFVIYDLKHKVEFHADHLVISFLGSEKKVFYHDIKEIICEGPAENFATFKIRTDHKMHRFYFIDDGQKIKKWMEENSENQDMAA